MDKEAYRLVQNVEANHWWHVSRRAIIKKVLDVFMPSSPSVILEAGCGAGPNLDLLTSYGSVFGFEMDEGSVSTAADLNIAKVKLGSLPYNVPFDQNFDLICMLDVLEHIKDDFTTLEVLNSRLNKGGKLLLTVPAYMFLWSEFDVVAHHFRRYIKKDLIQLIISSGFNVKYSTYFNTYLFPIVSTVWFFNNVLGRKIVKDIEMPSNIVNSVLKSVFTSERFFFPRFSFPFGVSILLLAEKG